MRVTWWAALLLCLASFVGFGIVVIFGRRSTARRASVAMIVSGFLTVLSLLMYATR